MPLPLDVTVLGDPHLGKKFRTGVPLHRIGDREAMVWGNFQASLRSHNGSIHVNMGDLFDKFVVAPEVVLRAAEIYRSAAKDLSSCTFIVLMGNHDVSRDSTKASSFDLFEQLVAGVKNIKVVRGDKPFVYQKRLGFVPFHPFKPTEELVAQLPSGLEAVFGHWDIVDFGGNNVIPTKLLAEKGLPLAISGHDHVARTETRHGVEIIVTGSMQPYTHAEDPDHDFYRTVTLDELKNIPDLTNLNVRVLLREGEVLPDDIDCLSLTAKRVGNDDEDMTIDTAQFESLDLRTMLGSVLEGLLCKDTLLAQFEEGREE